MIDDKEKNKSYLVTGGSDCLIVLIDISKGLEGDFDLYDSNNFMEQLETPIVSALFVIDKTESDFWMVLKVRISPLKSDISDHVTQNQIQLSLFI